MIQYTLHFTEIIKNIQVSYFKIQFDRFHFPYSLLYSILINQNRKVFDKI